jgi:glycosyltransferase involved in cell wall biosynthesis
VNNSLRAAHFQLECWREPRPRVDGEEIDMRSRRFFFYQDYPNVHFLPVLRALAERNQVILCVDREMDPGRARMGFGLPEAGCVEIRVGPSREEIKTNIITGHRDDVHIANFSRGNHTAAALRWLRRRTPFRFGILSEYLKFGRRRLLSVPYCLYTLSQVKLYRPMVDFVLAMGDLGVRQFRRLGFDASRLFPYGYAVEPSDTSRNATSVWGPGFRIMFVGALHPWKALDVLFRALAGIQMYEWELLVVGEGPEEAGLRVLARDLGVDDRIRWRGFTSNVETRALMRGSDLLVLPSRYEGWGAVVNEALMAGTCVVASDRCGSSVLLSDERRGDVFHAGQVEDLRRVLARRIAAGPTTECLRRAIRAWSQRVDGPSVAAYTERIMECVYHQAARPVPVWCQATTDSVPTRQ